MKPIKTLIDEELLSERGAPRKRSGCFSPSLFGRCYRAQVFNRMNEPKTDEVEERVLRVFKAGKLFHDFVQDVITKNNPSIKIEVKIEEDDVLGFADIVNGDCVVDIKSVHSGAFHYMGDDISESKKPNILQVLYYARQLGLKKAVLCFVSKDDLCIDERVIILNEKWEKELADELSTLRELWEKLPELPSPGPRAYKDNRTGKPKEGEYCSWYSKCLSMGYDCKKLKEVKGEASK